MRRAFLGLLFTTCFSFQVSASVFSINLNEPGGLPGTGGTFFPPCYCQPTGYLSPIYEFSAGDIVYFGSVTMGSLYAGSTTPQPGQEAIVAFIQSGLGVSFDSNQTPYPGVASFYNGPLVSQPLSPTTYDLSFTIPDGAHSIQLGWFSGSYVPGVPELSTWAMILLGFAGLGLMGYRGSRASSGAYDVVKQCLERLACRANPQAPVSGE